MIDALFKLMEHKSYKMKKDGKINGKEYWQPYKNLFDKYQIPNLKWKKINKNLLLTLYQPEYFIDGFGNTKIIEDNHFLIQTVRIPYQEECNLKKLMQIALNSGQYYASTGQKLNYVKLDTYISKSHVQKINTFLKDDNLLDIINNME
jgi:hypothetical protein